jgi:hypothetical protein
MVVGAVAVGAASIRRRRRGSRSARRRLLPLPLLEAGGDLGGEGHG